jgi:hypothetical protein
MRPTVTDEIPASRRSIRIPADRTQEEIEMDDLNYPAAGVAAVAAFAAGFAWYVALAGPYARLAPAPQQGCPLGVPAASRAPLYVSSQS